jgi:hypothetical protein
VRKPHPLTGFIPVRRREGSFDLEDVAKADYAIERALGGDLRPLADRLRSAKRLLPAERAMAADFFDGTRKSKNPAHRPVKDETRQQAMLLALAVWHQMQLGATEKTAVKRVSESERKSERTVRVSVAAHPEMFTGLKRRRVRARKSQT